MLVGVNTLTIAPGRGGIEEFFLRNALAQVRNLQTETRFVLFTSTQNHASFEGWDRICVGESGGRVRGRLAAWEGPLIEAIERSGADLLFSPLDPPITKWPVPLVLYVMDLSHYETIPAKGGWGSGAKLKAAKQLCRGAGAVVAPSQHIQDVLLEVLETPLNKVVVAPLGVDEVFGQPQACMVQQPYLLTVGDTDESRNIPRLRAALERMKDEIPDHSLVVVGIPGEAEPSSWGDSVVRIERCAAAHLASLYQHCDLCICPSLYEASGIAVLQAMRAGARVLTSRVGGIPEVAGDVPLYFNPESVGSLIGGIRRGLKKDEPQLEHRIAYGRQVAKGYTWEKCAWKTLSAFKRA